MKEETLTNLSKQLTIVTETILPNYRSYPHTIEPNVNLITCVDKRFLQSIQVPESAYLDREAV